MIKNCLICDRINQIKAGTNPYFVKELQTGYVVLGDEQFYRGYTLLLCKKHVSELHQLPSKFKQMFLDEMSLVAQAVYQTFQPVKLNYELLGNCDPHLHWHLFPRYQSDPLPEKSVWSLDAKIRHDPRTRPSPAQLARDKNLLLTTLEKIIHPDSNCSY
jgi:diadenosine tetraphosphate (Ap4A) HIT family hydrolase